MKNIYLTEEDTKYRYITPAIEKAGWTKDQCFMEYYFTDGQILIRGDVVKRAESKKADYLLVTKEGNKPLAVVEAKSIEKSVSDGMQQAIEYAKILDVPFAYSSNGEGFIEHDMLNGTEKELRMSDFPSEYELWNRYKAHHNIDKYEEEIIKKPDYFDTISQKKPRYYQRIAIDRTVEAVAKGQDRVLLVMATGTGKTFVAFQIVYKLLQSDNVKKVLYLADRNILIDQTMQQDFKPLDKVMTKIKGKNLDSAYEVYMSLYHQLSGDDNNEPFREFKPDFFDLIIVDEAHRGSAKADSQWRKILDYFDSAIHIGLTATPKETKEVSNIHYFGDPIYTYSLKQGINDGFLAPYKVIRVKLDIDDGWRPIKDMVDDDGDLIEDREYNVKDYDRNIIIDNRTKMVAKTVTKWLKQNDRFAKTIIFCVNINHAERMRQALINENTDLVAQNPNYIMRITGDNPDGKAKLDYFIDKYERYPTIVTTSKLMTTGVDAKTTKLIVLDNNINSMTEFKQIIGRGTRLETEFGKEYFTIMDFRDASRLFADPEFDGDPVQIIDIDPNESEGYYYLDETDNNPEHCSEETGEYETEVSTGFVPPEVPEKQKIYILKDGVEVKVINERIQYYDIDGKLITESIRDYTRNNIRKEFDSLDNFIHNWTTAQKKEVIIKELEQRGVLLDALRDESNKDMDEFDLILHLAFDKEPLTRKERAEAVKKRDYLNKYEPVAKEVLNALLDKYSDSGIKDLEDIKILANDPFNKYGSPNKIVKIFGGKDAYLEAVQDLSNMIYGVA